MNTLARELRANPLVWRLAAVPAVFAVERLAPDRHTTLFVLAVLLLVVYATFALTLYLLPPPTG